MGLPAILEIPSKDSPYDPNKDSILRRAKGMFSAEDLKYIAGISNNGSPGFIIPADFKKNPISDRFLSRSDKNIYDSGVFLCGIKKIIFLYVPMSDLLCVILGLVSSALI